MTTKKIVFTAPAVYDLVEGKIHYQVGQVVELREDIADRWLILNLATDDAEAVAKAEAALAPPATEAAPPAPPAPTETGDQSGTSNDGDGGGGKPPRRGAR